MNWVPKKNHDVANVFSNAVTLDRCTPVNLQFDNRHYRTYLGFIADVYFRAMILATFSRLRPPK